MIALPPFFSALTALASLLSSPDVVVARKHESSRLDTRSFSNDKANVFAPTKYSVVEGFFEQDLPTFNASAFDVLNTTSSFGLLDKSEDRWKTFAKKIRKLNKEADDLTAYRVVFIARHGEGYHNLAESTYGTPLWNCHWSLLNGDGNITWGPDATLTPNGIAQAQKNNLAWKAQIEAGVPLPQSLYSSPMRRAASTLEITWSDILLNKKGYTPRIKEELRESIGLHTCDKRSDKSVLVDAHPKWQFDADFTEHDQLWNPIWQEQRPQQTLRLQQLLNEIFSTDSSTYISITCHSGVIGSFFGAIGHRVFSVQTGGMVPVVIKAVGHKDVSSPVITGGQSGTAPVCAATATVASSSSSAVAAAPATLTASATAVISSLLRSTSVSATSSSA